MKLTNPTGPELNLAFASEVCKWTVDELSEKVIHGGADFVKSADAVLPWLEKAHWKRISHGMGKWALEVTLSPTAGSPDSGESSHPSFAKAAVIALLRAHGVEIEFTT